MDKYTEAASESGSFEDDLNTYDDAVPWDYVDGILKRYHEEIKAEKILINETGIILVNVPLRVSTGLSAARGFLPAVKLTHMAENFNNDTIITMMDIDWYELIENIKTVAEGAEKEFSDFKMSRITSACENIVKLEIRDSELYFNDDTISQLLYFSDVIKFRLELLKSLDFPQFYNNALLHVANQEDIITHIKGFCNMTQNIQSYCTLELLKVNRERIFIDLSKF